MGSLFGIWVVKYEQAAATLHACCGLILELLNCLEYRSYSPSAYIAKPFGIHPNIR